MVTISKSNIETSLGLEIGETQSAFIAMEYWALILNRTYLVLAKAGMLCGAKVRGLSASPLTPRGVKQWLDLRFYLTDKISAGYRGIDPVSSQFLSLNRANFQVRCNQITRIRFDPSPKRGMGNVPHTGKVYIITTNSKKRELILLADQDGYAIEKQLTSLI